MNCSKCKAPGMCVCGPITLADALRKPLTHPTVEKQRAYMHKRVEADAKLRHDEMAELRRRAEQRDARRNEPITRGEILDALDAAMYARGGNVGDHHEADMEVLRALREAFE